MRILKSGIIPEYNFQCHICGCEFIALRTECKIHEFALWPETKIHKSAYIDCPDCHTELVCDITEEQKND